MIILKIEVIDENSLVIYYSLIFDNILEYKTEDIKSFIQMLVIRLRKNYHLDLKGYYHLNVYINKIAILEFERIDDYEDEIDLNIIIHTNTPVLVELEDYFLFPGRKYYYQEKYYLPIEQIQYEKYIEFIKFIYGKKAKNILNCGNLV